MRDDSTALLDARGQEIIVGSRVKVGSETGTVRRTEPGYGVMTIIVEERNAKKERMVRAAAVEVLPAEPVATQAAPGLATEHAADHPAGDRMYYTTWLWLLGITVFEVGVAILHIPRVLLIMTLVVMSFLKAILIMATFMHLRFERIQFIYVVVMPLFLGVLLFFALVPDALNNLTRSPVQASEPAAPPGPPAPGPARPGGPAAPGPVGPVATGSTIAVVGRDNFYAPDAVTLAAGREYQFSFKNEGTTIHNLLVGVKSAVGEDVASDVAVNVGQESKFTVKIDAPGTYGMSCTYHPEMIGTLTVR